MNSTTPEFHEYLVGLRTSEVSASLSFHEDDQLWHTNTFAKAKRGLYHVETTYEGDMPCSAKLIRDARIYGRFSWRPVRMGQYFDASMQFGVLDLLHHWCDEQRVDLLALVQRAYPGQAFATPDDVAEIRAQAHWEGIVYPPQWSTALSRELATALVEVGYSRLAALVAHGLSRIR